MDDVWNSSEEVVKSGRFQELGRSRWLYKEYCERMLGLEPSSTAGKG